MIESFVLGDLIFKQLGWNEVLSVNSTKLKGTRFTFVEYVYKLANISFFYSRQWLAADRSKYIIVSLTKDFF